MKGKTTAATIFSCPVLLCGFAANTIAQDEGAALYLGPFDVVPTLGLDVRKDDNIFSQTSGNEVSSTLTLVRPAVSISTDDGVVRYGLN